MLLTSFILAFINLNVAFKLISRIFLTGAAFLFDKLLKIYTLITAALAISIIPSYITPTIIARDSAFPSNASEISWKGNYFLVGLCLPLSLIMPLFFLHENFVTTRESSCYFHYIEVSTHFLFFLLIWIINGLNFFVFCALSPPPLQIFSRYFLLLFCLFFLQLSQYSFETSQFEGNSFWAHNSVIAFFCSWDFYRINLVLKDKTVWHKLHTSLQWIHGDWWWKFYSDSLW